MVTTAQLSTTTAFTSTYYLLICFYFIVGELGTGLEALIIKRSLLRRADMSGRRSPDFVGAELSLPEA